MRASDRIPFSASAEEKAWPAGGSSIASALANAVQRKEKNVGAAVLIRLAGMDPDRRGRACRAGRDGRVAAVLSTSPISRRDCRLKAADGFYSVPPCGVPANTDTIVLACNDIPPAGELNSRLFEPVMNLLVSFGCLPAAF